MRLQNLILHNFRTYEEAMIDLSGSDVHVLIGPNGMGKTNLLEGISMLSGARSFLGVEDRYLVQWNKDFFRVRGNVLLRDQESRLEVFEEFFPRIRKAYFVNDAPVKLRDFIGIFPTVSFLPQDLDLLRGPPALRRRLIDRILCQTSGEYLQHMVAYARCLKQRNALLRQIKGLPPPEGEDEGGGVKMSNRDELLVWDQEISSLSSLITLERLALIQSLTAALKTKLSTLGLSCDTASMAYERQSTAHTLSELQDEFLTLLQNSHERDIRMQSTTIGPHRDDWRLFIDGRPAETWMSRGEQRLCIVTLFLLQAAYVCDVKEEQPVILLDDVFSELDSVHRQLLCDHLTGHQILITGTHPLPVDRDWAMWEVEKGRVIGTSPIGGGLRRGGAMAASLSKTYLTPSP